jgi:hypothetical protein
MMTLLGEFGSRGVATIAPTENCYFHGCSARIARRPFLTHGNATSLYSLRTL